MHRHFNRIAVAAVLLGLAAVIWWLPNALVPRGSGIEAERRHEPDYTIENFTAIAMDASGLARMSCAPCGSIISRTTTPWSSNALTWSSIPRTGRRCIPVRTAASPRPTPRKS
jgi:hypothetical protein